MGALWGRTQRFHLASRAAVYGAELPMQLQGNYAGNCPICAIHQPPRVRLRWWFRVITGSPDW
jgi:hypothetical protein